MSGKQNLLSVSGAALRRGRAVGQLDEVLARRTSS